MRGTRGARKEKKTQRLVKMSQLFLSETVGAGVGRGVGGLYKLQLMVFALRFPIIHKIFYYYSIFFVTGICEILELFSIANVLDHRSLTK